METISVPFLLPVDFIDDLVAGMAMHMLVPVPETDQGKLDLFQNWVKYSAKEAIHNARFQQAVEAVDFTDVDSW